MQDQFAYYLKHAQRSLWTAEIVQLLCIYVGIGATPFLRRLTPWFWAAGIALGLVAVVVGVAIAWQVRRLRARRQPTAVHPTSAARPALLQRLLAPFHRLASRLRRRRAAPEASSSFRARAEDASSDMPPRVVLPAATILIGVFTVIPAAVAAFVQWNPVIDDEHLVAMFFSGPAILLYIAAEGFYFYPRLVEKPKRTAEIAGMARSLTKSISALLLWVYLGLAFGMDGIGWMFWTSIALAGASLVLGTLANRQSLRRQQERDALEQALQDIQNAPPASVATS